MSFPKLYAPMLKDVLLVQFYGDDAETVAVHFNDNVKLFSINDMGRLKAHVLSMGYPYIENEDQDDDGFSMYYHFHGNAQGVMNRLHILQKSYHPCGYGTRMSSTGPVRDGHDLMYGRVTRSLSCD